MSLFEKLQTIIMLGAVALGLTLGQLELPAKYGSDIIVPALTAMLFGLFLGIPLNDLKKSFFDKTFAFTSLAVNFIWIPVLGWILGAIFLGDHPALRLGFIMLLVTPCTDWYLVFTGLAKGNVTLSAAILPLNLIVQVLLLPLYLFLFAGLSGQVDFLILGKSILMVLLLPFGLAQLIRRGLAEGNHLRRTLVALFSEHQFFFLCVAIVAMFASQAQILVGETAVFALLLAPVLLFFAINFVVVRLLARLLKFTWPDSVSLSLTTLARNSPISLAVAVTAFPDEPLVALALVIGPLIELPVLGLISQLLLWLRPARVDQEMDSPAGDKIGPSQSF